MFEGKKSEKEKKSGKKHIELNPGEVTDRVRLAEAKLTQNQADYLVRLGLGKTDKITWYRTAILHPEQAMSNPAMRQYVVEVYQQLLNLVVGDPQMFLRLKTLLQRNFQDDGRLSEEVEPETNHRPLMKRVQKILES